jgi:DNA adenine methylase
VPEGLPPVHTDRHIYPDRTAADEAAKARLAAFNRSTASVRLDLPGRTDLFAEIMIEAQGFKRGLDGEYLVESVDHTFTPSGWTVSMECNGGKRRLADRLIPLFPPHECYVEVFAGGAALYFMRPQAAPVEVLNDINGDLVTLYRVVQNHLEEFVRQFKWALSSRQVFEWQKMTRLETLTDILRAARFFYLQHHAFAGKVTEQTFGTATTGPAINLLRIEETFRPPGNAYPAPTSKICLGWTAPNVATVPIPFTTWTRCTGRPQGMGWTSRSRITSAWHDFMRRCKGRVMVSINDHPDIRRVFEGFHFETLDIRYTTTNQRQGKAEVSGELEIMNWEPAALGGLF